MYGYVIAFIHYNVEDFMHKTQMYAYTDSFDKLFNHHIQLC